MAVKKVQYPVKVYCVVDDLSESSRDTLVRDIKTHVIDSGALFTTRVYDSKRFSNDRNVIIRLPAFHVYINNSYNRTFYANTRPLDHINECIAIYLKTEDEKVQRKARWFKLYESFKKFLWRMVHRETAMERYEREKYIVSKKSRFENLKLNVSEWS